MHSSGCALAVAVRWLVCRYRRLCAAQPSIGSPGPPACQPGRPTGVLPRQRGAKLSEWRGHKAVPMMDVRWKYEARFVSAAGQDSGVALGHAAAMHVAHNASGGAGHRRAMPWRCGLIVVMLRQVI